MTNKVLLNNVDHHDLRVVQRYGREYGDAVNQVLLLPTEFEEAQREFPILFRRDPAGALQAVALLGFDKGENLFLQDEGWTGRYVPAVQRRGPFSIVMQRSSTGAPAEPMIHVDLDDPRVGRSQGDPLFLAQGGNAPALDRIADALGMLHEGFGLSEALYAAFDRFELVQPAQIDVRVGEGRRYDLPNFLSISEERLAALDPQQLAGLHAQGFLRLAFLVAASLGNLGRLAELKTLSLAAG